MKFLPHTSRGTAIALMVCVATGLTACSAPGTGATQPALLKAPALGLPEVRTAEVTDAWWQSWNDPQLDALMRQSLQDNPSLAVAQARVRRMQALAGVVDAASLPQGTLGADFSRQRYSANGPVSYTHLTLPTKRIV